MKTISALLISEHCTPCERVTDHELNTVACETECLDCRHVERVSEDYVRRTLAADDVEWGNQ